MPKTYGLTTIFFPGTVWLSPETTAREIGEAWPVKSLFIPPAGHCCKKATFSSARLRSFGLYCKWKPGEREQFSLHQHTNTYHTTFSSSLITAPNHHHHLNFKAPLPFYSVKQLRDCCLSMPNSLNKLNNVSRWLVDKRKYIVMQKSQGVALHTAMSNNIIMKFLWFLPLLFPCAEDAPVLSEAHISILTLVLVARNGIAGSS